jgi:hypothetical protein
MSTKFRQSFVRLFGGCRQPSKNQRSSAVLFCKDYAMRPMLMNVNRGGIISTTTALSYSPSNIHRLQEKKFLLLDNTPTPATATTMDTTKFIFP